MTGHLRSFRPFTLDYTRTDKLYHENFVPEICSNLAYSVLNAYNRNLLFNWAKMGCNWYAAYHMHHIILSYASYHMLHLELILLRKHCLVSKSWYRQKAKNNFHGSEIFMITSQIHVILIQVRRDEKYNGRKCISSCMSNLCNNATKIFLSLPFCLLIIFY